MLPKAIKFYSNNLYSYNMKNKLHNELNYVFIINVYLFLNRNISSFLILIEIFKKYSMSTEHCIICELRYLYFININLFR